MRRKPNLDSLIREAKRLGDHRTAIGAIEAALCEYITKRKQLEVINLFGKIDYDPDYDCKAARNRKFSPKSSGADPSRRIKGTARDVGSHAPVRDGVLKRTK